MISTLCDGSDVTYPQTPCSAPSYGNLRLPDPEGSWKDELQSKASLRIRLSSKFSCPPFGFELKDDGTFEYTTAKYSSDVTWRMNQWQKPDRALAPIIILTSSTNKKHGHLRRGVPFELSHWQAIPHADAWRTNVSCTRNLGSNRIAVRSIWNPYYVLNYEDFRWYLESDEALFPVLTEDAVLHGFRFVELLTQNLGGNTFLAKLGNLVEFYSDGVDAWVRIGNRAFSTDDEIAIIDPALEISIESKAGRDRLILRTGGEQRVFETTFRLVSQTQSYGRFWVERIPLLGQEALTVEAPTMRQLQEEQYFAAIRNGHVFPKLNPHLSSWQRFKLRRQKIRSTSSVSV